MPKFDAQTAAQVADFSRFKNGIEDWMFPADPGTGSLAVAPAPEEQMFALDNVQRGLAVGIGKVHGIPVIGDIFAEQMKFLRSTPAIEFGSDISRAFNTALRGDSAEAVEAAITTALNVVNKLGLQALQGITLITEAVTGAFDLIPFIGWFVNFGITAGRLISTYGPKEPDWKALKMERPIYDARNDRNAGKLINPALQSRNWTTIFSPQAYERQGMTTGGITTGNIGGTTLTTIFPQFAGRRTSEKGEWIFAQVGTDNKIVPPTRTDDEAWGFMPEWDGKGGRLWRGVLWKDGQTVWLGDRLPTSQSLGMEVWRSMFNPYAPQIFYADAVRLGNEWLSYLVNLRRALHVSHTKEAFQALKSIKNPTWTGDGPLSKRLWLSLSEIDDGNLEKKMQIRKDICNAIARITGWAPWQPGEDDLVGKLGDVVARSDDFYIDKFKINDAGPVKACRMLYRWQAAAAQSITAVYSEPSDPAFENAPDLRYFREQSIQKIMTVPDRARFIDEDLVPPGGGFASAAKQLWQQQNVSQFYGTATKVYSIKDLWFGDSAPPSRWPEQSNQTKIAPGAFRTGTLVSGSGGGSGGLVVAGAAAAAAAAFFFLR